MVLETVRKRNRARTFSCSDELWEKIEKSTNDCISVSKFIRDAVEDKIGYQEEYLKIAQNLKKEDV
jgi:hypothetical protein